MRGAVVRRGPLIPYGRHRPHESAGSLGGTAVACSISTMSSDPMAGQSCPPLGRRCRTTGACAVRPGQHGRAVGRLRDLGRSRRSRRSPPRCRAPPPRPAGPARWIRSRAAARRCRAAPDRRARAWPRPGPGWTGGQGGSSQSAARRTTPATRSGQAAGSVAGHAATHGVTGQDEPLRVDAGLLDEGRHERLGQVDVPRIVRTRAGVCPLRRIAQRLRIGDDEAELVGEVGETGGLLELRWHASCSRGRR